MDRVKLFHSLTVDRLDQQIDKFFNINKELINGIEDMKFFDTSTGFVIVLKLKVNKWEGDWFQ